MLVIGIGAPMLQSSLPTCHPSGGQLAGLAGPCRPARPPHHRVTPRVRVADLRVWASALLFRCFTDTGVKRRTTVVTLLWILAVVLVIAGIFAIFRGQMLWGIVLIVVGLLVGPGGVSVFT